MTAQSEPPLLRTEGVGVAFATPRGPLRAVDDVSFSLHRGRTLGIVGESGSGKSVLMRTVMGLLSHRHATVAGRVEFNGRVLSDLDDRAKQRIWGREIAMVFQNPMTSLNPVLTVGTQIAEPLRHHLGMSRRAARDRAGDLLASVGFPDARARLDTYPHQLSGGMRQRVAIAMALSCEPLLLIADEATTALDVTIQAQILDLLHQEQRRRDMALVLVTHDLGVAAGRTDEVMVMYAGRIAESAATTDLFRATRHPYTAGLLASIPRLEQPSHTRLTVVPGRPPDLVSAPGACRFAPRCPRATGRCAQRQPALTGAAHRVACWHPLGGETFDEEGAA